jgi:hypothetical protein
MFHTSCKYDIFSKNTELTLEQDFNPKILNDQTWVAGSFG